MVCQSKACYGIIMFERILFILCYNKSVNTNMMDFGCTWGLSCRQTKLQAFSRSLEHSMFRVRGTYKCSCLNCNLVLPAGCELGHLILLLKTVMDNVWTSIIGQCPFSQCWQIMYSSSVIRISLFTTLWSWHLTYKNSSDTELILWYQWCKLGQYPLVDKSCTHALSYDFDI